MNGKILVAGLALVTVMTAASVYYLQVYGYYDDVSELAGDDMRLTLLDGDQIPLATGDFRAIDSDSSPLRYRACFTIDPALADGAQPFDGATPLNGPSWFHCYSARALTEDLASGQARAYLGQPEIRPDVDRVIAVYPDGRAFAWHQLNDKTPERGVMD